MQPLVLDSLTRVRIGPQRNEVREQNVRNWLTMIDPSLDIRWVNNVVVEHDAVDTMTNYEGRYALIFYISSEDPDAKHAQQVGLEHPYATLGWFCEDMNVASSRPIPCDEMEPLVRGFLSAMDSSRTELKVRLRETSQKNRDFEEYRKADYVDEAVQRALDARRTAFGIPYVSGYR